MARDGSGTFNRLFSWVTERDAGNPIDSTDMDSEMDGMATALTDSVAKDGQTTATANLPMGGFKHTNVATATARNHYAATSQVQDSSVTLIGSVSGTDTITGSLTPALTAYATGQVFSFVSAGANTGAATLNINSVGAKTIAKDVSTALGPGDIPASSIVTVAYDGTRFRLMTSKDVSGWEFVVTQTASDDTELAFYDLDSGYDHLFVGNDMNSATDGQRMRIQTSTGSGESPTYGTTNYEYNYLMVVDGTASAQVLQGAGGAFIETSGAAMGNNTGEDGLAFEWEIRDPTSGGDRLGFFRGQYKDTSTNNIYIVGQTDNFGAVVAVRFYMNSTNISGGTIRHYRRKIQ